MDTATVIVLVALGTLLATLMLLKWVRFLEPWRLGLIAIVASIVFLAVDSLGEVFAGWGANGACHKYLGCDAGFFGYDAVEHFLFGFTAVLLIFWLSRKFHRISFYLEKRWKTILFVISFVILLAILWECLEAIWDFVRPAVLHIVVFNWREHIDLLEQPTNLDTMGDVFFGFLGSVISFCAIWFMDSGIAKGK